MKEKLELFNKLIESVDVGMFYSITISEYDIRMQGRFNAENAKRISDMGYIGKVKKNGYIEFTKVDSPSVAFILT